MAAWRSEWSAALALCKARPCRVTERAASAARNEASPENAAVDAYRAQRLAPDADEASPPAAGAAAAAVAAPPFVRAGGKVGRNDPCPCGSGKKFKQCHGKLA